MKKIICLIGCLLHLSCVSQQNNKNSTKKYALTQNEKLIINDFLDFELKKDKYENYKRLQPLLIQEAISKESSLKIYSYCYDERNLKFRSSSNKDWILNGIDIKKIQDTLRNIKYFWKTSDITHFKVSTIAVDVINRSTKSYKEYEKYSKNIIFYMSVPMVFKQNYAIISYHSISGIAGYSTIDMFTVLLKKNESGTWKVNSYYYDPNTSW